MNLVPLLFQNIFPNFDIVFHYSNIPQLMKIVYYITICLGYPNAINHVFNTIFFYPRIKKSFVHLFCKLSEPGRRARANSLSRVHVKPNEK